VGASTDQRLAMDLKKLQALLADPAKTKQDLMGVIVLFM
jgi:hypothetical protein